MKHIKNHPGFWSCLRGFKEARGFISVCACCRDTGLCSASMLLNWTESAHEFITDSSEARLMKCLHLRASQPSWRSSDMMCGRRWPLWVLWIWTLRATQTPQSLLGAPEEPQSHATIKGTVHQKWTCAESVIACRSSEICFFIRFGEMCLSNGSEWVPSEWESYKNITIIHFPSANIWRGQKITQIQH